MRSADGPAARYFICSFILAPSRTALVPVQSRRWTLGQASLVRARGSTPPGELHLDPGGTGPCSRAGRPDNDLPRLLFLVAADG